jgi:hypothetical protein
MEKVGSSKVIGDYLMTAPTVQRTEGSRHAALRAVVGADGNPPASRGQRTVDWRRFAPEGETGFPLARK